MKRVCGSLVCLVFLSILGVTSLQAQDGLWAQLTPTGPLPTACGYPSAVYDSARDRILVFGGVVWATSFNDVWALSLGGSSQWTKLTPSGALPNTRHNHAAIYDPVRDQMIIFGGGRYHEGPWNDVWALSLDGSPHWTQLAPTGVLPGARAGFNAIYDPLRDRMLIFGGGSATGAYNDVWALSLGGSPQWTELTPSGTPPSPRGSPVIYDPVRDRMVLFGGCGPSGCLNDAWALSLDGSPHWTQLTPSGTPPVPRGAFTTVYDAAGDRMVVFGGNRIDHAAYLGNNEVWALSLGDSPQWTQLAPSGTLPVGRYSQMAVYDLTRGQMIVTSGDSYYGNYLNDAWALTWGPPSGVFTPRGGDVVVVPPDSLTGATPVTVTFNSVIVAGFTSLHIYDTGPPPKHGFSLCGKYYDLRTTAVYTGSVEVCIDYSGTKCKKPRLQHYEGSQWVDVVPSYAGPGPSIICGKVSSLSLFALFEPIPVAFDIKPGSCPNPFNTKWLKNIDNGNGNSNGSMNRGGVMPAAIVGSETFDVANVDVSTLLLEGVAPLRSNFEDVTRPATGDEECSCTSDGPDGIMDLTLKFSRQEIAATFGPVENGDVVVLTITGALLDGTPFETSDCVSILSKQREPMTFATSNEVQLAPPMPNPFNPVVAIAYWLPESGFVTLCVYDAQGRIAERLVEGVQAEGEHVIEWDADKLASGVYFCRLTVGGEVLTRKMVLLK